MHYNAYVSSGTTSFDNDWVILAIDVVLLNRLVEAYLRGVHEIKYVGKTYSIAAYYFQIYEIPQKLGTDVEAIKSTFLNVKKNHFNDKWDEGILSSVCRNVTSEFLKGREWGELKDDLFNVYVNSDGKRGIKTTVEKEELEKFIQDWQHGRSSGWLEGKEVILRNPSAFVIYDISLKYRSENKGETKKYINKLIRLSYTNKWTTEALEEFGKDVTSIFKVGPYGSKQIDSHANKVIVNNAQQLFINNKRIDDLRNIKSKNFDLNRLIQFCEELNINYQNGSFISVILLSRSLIDHVPPIFGKTSFGEVSGDCGTKSFREQMVHLDKSMRKIADSYLHTHIRKQETLPTSHQVNFAPGIDVLISEICRHLKENEIV